MSPLAWLSSLRSPAVLYARKSVTLEVEGRVVSADPSPEGPRLLNKYGPGIVVQWTEP